MTGGPLASLRDLNIDAITMWFFQGLTIDGLPRSLWYTPQHAAACALGLVALTVLTQTGAKGALSVRLLSGLALGLSVTMSPFLGGAFSLVYAAAVLMDAALERRHFLGIVLGHAWAALPVALAVAWVLLGDVLEGARGALVLGFVGKARRAPIVTILLALGPLLIPAVLGLFAAGEREHRRRMLPALGGVSVGLALFYLVSLARTDPVWVGWRAGQIMLVCLPSLAALFISWSWERAGRRTPAALLLACAFAVGFPPP